MPPTPDPQALDRVLLADQRLDHARIALDEAVADARRSGVSWQAIGDTLGMSRQAVFKRFTRVDDLPAAQPRDPHPLERLTESAFRDLAQGRAARLPELMTPYAASALSVADLEATWAAARRANGNLVCFRDTEIRTTAHRAVEGTEVAGDLVATTTLVCEEGTWHGRIAWDAWDRIAGLLIAPTDSSDLPF